MTEGPAAAWSSLADGNARVVDGRAEHPHQDAGRRASLAAGQHPVAAVLGCSDSRVPPEVVMDAGLGDLFVIRNAGQIADAGAIASIEYAVEVLGVPLVVVLAHEACGAVRAAIAAASADPPALPPHIAAHVAAIRPAVDAAGSGDEAEVLHAHLEATVAALIAGSELLTAAVAAGTVDVVGAEYGLADGRVVRRIALGPAA